MNRPWMPLYVADYLADTAHLNAAESGAYLHLIMHYWRADGLPENEEQLRRISRMSARQWSQSRDLLRSLFDDHWRHKRIDHEIAQATEKSRTNSANAKRSHSERKQVADVSQVRSQTQSQSHTQSERKEDKQTTSLRSDADDWPDDAAEQFWKKYPHKVGKADAMKKLAIARRRGISFGTLMFGVERYINEKPPDRNWCNPSTWLYQERWADEPAKLPINGARHGRPGLGDTADDLIARAESAEREAGFGGHDRT